MRTPTQKLSVTNARLDYYYVEILSFESERAVVLVEDESLKSISIHDLSVVEYEEITYEEISN